MMADSPEDAARLSKSEDRMTEKIIKMLEKEDEAKKRKGDDRDDGDKNASKRIKNSGGN